jgi:ankyrin repeat protein
MRRYNACLGVLLLLSALFAAVRPAFAQGVCPSCKQRYQTGKFCTRSLHKAAVRLVSSTPKKKEPEKPKTASNTRKPRENKSKPPPVKEQIVKDKTLQKPPVVKDPVKPPVIVSPPPTTVTFKAAASNKIKASLNQYAGNENDETRTKIHDNITDALDENGDPDQPDDTGKTALMWAIEVDDSDLFRKILKLKKKHNTLKTLDRGDGEGNTAAHYAIQKHAKYVEGLLEHGARVDVVNKAGETPLVRAIRESGDANIVALLLTKKANPRLADNDGYFPLYWAVKKGSVEIAEQLLAANADLDAKTKEGRTALSLAAELGNADLVNLLLDGEKKANPNIADNNDYLPLHWAAKTGNTDIAKKLIEAKADVNAKTKEGKSVLEFAQEAGNTDIVTELKAKGAM